jgi:hypothetical protein
MNFLKPILIRLQPNLLVAFLKNNRKIPYAIFVWVWWDKFAHHTFGFGIVWFFGLGCFSFCVMSVGRGQWHVLCFLQMVLAP